MNRGPHSFRAFAFANYLFEAGTFKMKIKLTPFDFKTGAKRAKCEEYTLKIVLWGRSIPLIMKLRNSKLLQLFYFSGFPLCFQTIEN